MLTIKTVKNNRDFRFIMNQGIKQVSSSFIVFVYRNNNLVAPRNYLEAGYTVSSRVGNAVIRNKIKRRFRHVLRESIKELLIVDDNGTNSFYNSLLSISICFVARYNSFYFNFDKMKQDLKKILIKYV